MSKETALRFTGTQEAAPETAPESVPETVPVVYVTPEQAQKWLDSRYTNERPVRWGSVEAYARDMKSGNWRFNGDPIRFDTDGHLVDGQHRLSALVAAEKTLPFVVVNIDPEVRATIDTGNARSLGDLLHMGNHARGRILAALVRRVLFFEEAGVTGNSGHYRPSHAEAVAYVRANADHLNEAVEWAVRKPRSLPVAASVVGSGWYLCSKISRQAADDFYDAVITGTDLPPGHPALAFRERAIRHLVTTGGTMLPSPAMQALLRAWNVYRTGGTLARMVTPRDGWPNVAPELL